MRAEKIRRGTALQLLVCILAAVMILTIYPLRLWRVTESVTLGEGVARTTMENGNGKFTKGITPKKDAGIHFYACYGHLESFTVVARAEEGAYMQALLYELEEGDINRPILIGGDMLALPEGLSVPTFLMDVDTKPGHHYVLVLSTQEAKAQVLLTADPESGTVAGNSQMLAFYKDTQLENYWMVITQTYTRPLPMVPSLLWMGGIALGAVLLCLLIEGVSRRRGAKGKEARPVTLGQLRAWILIPAAIAVSVAGFVMTFPMKVFDVRVPDIILYCAGFALFGIIAVYLLMRGSGLCESDAPVRTVRELIPMALLRLWDYVPAILTALVLWACCQYMNGLYDAAHTKAERQQTLFWALLLIVLMVRGYLENKKAGRKGFLAQTRLFGGKRGSFRENFRAQPLSSKIALILIPAAFVLYFTWSILFRNGRWWTTALAVALLISYLVIAFTQGAARDLGKILTDGILLHFALMVIYCLLHRYYLTFIYTRYSMHFHTVTVTAEYLTMVIAAALTRYLEDKEAGRDRPSDLLYAGTAMVYMFLTMSRTAFLAVAVMGVVLLVAYGLRRHSAKEPLAAMGAVLLAMGILFAPVFTLQRTVPAILQEPHLFAIETYPDEVMRGHHTDSQYYISIERFTRVLGNKLLGLPEGDYTEYIPEGQELGAGLSPDGSRPSWAISEGEQIIRPSRGGSGRGGRAGGSGLEALALSENDKELLAGGDKLYRPRTLGRIYPPGMEGAFSEDEDGEGGYGGSMGDEDLDSDFEFDDEPVVIILPAEVEVYSNGRTDIWRAYLSLMNLTGHAEMSAPMPEGDPAVHAHNAFLQTGYDHGWPAALFMGLLVLMVMIVSFRMYTGKRIGTALPLSAVLAFAGTGLVEWVLQYSNPMTFFFFMGLAVLMSAAPREEKAG